MWTQTYDWTATDGHEWSAPWGTTTDQWLTTVLPRIYPLLPTEAVLELGMGYGRWTPYLLDQSARYTGLDIAEGAVAACRRVYGGLRSHPRFLLGDGFRFEGVADSSISLVFSFDSLVHAELDSLVAYGAEMYRVLQPGGHAFVHHSNIGEYVRDGALSVLNLGWRAASVTAVEVSAAFGAAGLACLVHEKVQWRWATGDYVDCFTLARKPDGHAVEAAPDIYYNDEFAAEIALSRRRSETYARRLTR